MTKVVISGGSGLIGRALVGELLAAGWEPVVLSRRPEGVRGLPAGVSVREWDGVAAEQLADEIDGCSAMVHLAGEGIASGRWTEGRKRRLRQSRVRSSRSVVEAFRICEKRPAVLLQASAVGYYGARGDERLDEGSAPGQGFLAGLCVEWEEASAGAEELGVRRVLLRTGVVLSLGGGALPRMALPFRLFIGGRLGSGKQWLPWIHVADEVAAIRFLLEHDEARGPFNLTAPEPVTNGDFTRALARALGRPVMLPVPALALRLALGEMSTILLDGQRAVPRRLQELGYEFRFPEAGGALEALLT